MDSDASLIPLSIPPLTRSASHVDPESTATRRRPLREERTDSFSVIAEDEEPPEEITKMAEKDQEVREAIDILPPAVYKQDAEKAKISNIALTDEHIATIMNSLNINVNIITLSELDSKLDKLTLNTVIHTGEQEDMYNNGYTNHWLCLFGNYIFDSYGLEKKYKLPVSLEVVKTLPRQLQNYGTSVCGQYVCQFLFFCNFIIPNEYKNRVDSDSESQNLNDTSSSEEEEDENYGSGSNLGRLFSTHYLYSKDRTENDVTVLEWFEKMQNNLLN